MALQPESHASAQTNRNLAYDDNFVWYLSGRLASDLVESQIASGIKPGKEGDWGEIRMQYEILYHRYLVECSGPLPKIAEIVQFSYPSSAEPPVAVLASVGKLNYRFWPVIREWNGKILVQLMSTFASGHYGFFPECIVAGYRQQNPRAR